MQSAFFLEIASLLVSNKKCIFLHKSYKSPAKIWFLCFYTNIIWFWLKVNKANVNLFHPVVLSPPPHPQRSGDKINVSKKCMHNLLQNISYTFIIHV